MSVCVCLFDLECVNATGLRPVGQKSGKRGKRERERGVLRGRASRKGEKSVCDVSLH